METVQSETLSKNSTNPVLSAFKMAIRILISIIIGIPTLWILYISFTCFGLFLLVPIVGFFGIPFNWLINDMEAMNECIETFQMGGYLLIAPFAFWYYFIIGKNPHSMQKRTKMGKPIR